ncbi:MAG: hypothetical protein WC789_09485 [Lentisphaeria bacterium]
MAEHGFLFKPEMVRALLDGRKTQTRRICTVHNSTIDGGPTGKALWARLDWSAPPAYPKLPAPYVDGYASTGQYWHVPMRPHPADCQTAADLWTVHRVYPRVQVGDVVWVRETWRSEVQDTGGMPSGAHVGGHGIAYQADRGFRFEDRARKYWPERNGWRSAMLMPRWAARALRRVTAIRAQRVQEISEEDALAEGVDRTNTSLRGYATERFRRLWDSCNGHRPGCAWADNPAVWAYSFERVEVPRG